LSIAGAYNLPNDPKRCGLVVGAGATSFALLASMSPNHSTVFRSTSASACYNDDIIIGPGVTGCRDNFDFTIAFEDSILSLVPSVCFLFLALLRIFHLYGKPSLVSGRGLLYAKLVSYPQTSLVFSLAVRSLVLTDIYYHLRCSGVVLVGANQQDSYKPSSQCRGFVVLGRRGFPASIRP
jgi:hypothetical protein